MLSLRTLSLSLLSAAGLFCSAAIPQPTTAELAGNNLAYPYLDKAPAMTPPPAGYVPFHLEHYGRHGSRYHIGGWNYDYPVTELEKAERVGVLTPLGKQLLDSARVYRQQAIKRDGELSDMGALQHQAIGRRIGTNFPEIFSKENSYVDAKSTVVRRCILSMLNEVKELQALYPKMRITADSSEADMYYMNACGSDSVISSRRGEAKKKLMKDLFMSHANDGTLYLPKLFTSSQFAKDSINAPILATAIIQLLEMTQSHSNQNGLGMLDEIFTFDELKNDWLTRNASWFLDAGNTPLTGGDAALEHAWLLDNFILSADTAMTSTTTGANLRFGHDSIVLPLAILMQLDNCAAEYQTLDELDGNWADYLIIPMAANIQMVFYRPEGSTNPDDVLVKVLLNERETLLPVEPVSGPYVKWTTLRDYYKSIIDPYISSHTPKK